MAGRKSQQSHLPNLPAVFTFSQLLNRNRACAGLDVLNWNMHLGFKYASATLTKMQILLAFNVKLHLVLGLDKFLSNPGNPRGETFNPIPRLVEWTFETEI